MAFLRRLMALGPRLGHLIRSASEPVSCTERSRSSTSTALHEAAQRFVVGALVSRVFDEKQGTGREPLRFVMLDELNKYAPREGHGPLRELFVDIAERGRSPRRAADRLPAGRRPGRRAASSASPALKVAGRLDATEAAEYRFLTAGAARARDALPARARWCSTSRCVPRPIPIRFPFPPYATNVVRRGDRRGRARALPTTAFDEAAG